jgi:hypothetical protein
VFAASEQQCKELNGMSDSGRSQTSMPSSSSGCSLLRGRAKAHRSFENSRRLRHLPTQTDKATATTEGGATHKRLCSLIDVRSLLISNRPGSKYHTSISLTRLCILFEAQPRPFQVKQLHCVRQKRPSSRVLPQNSKVERSTSSYIVVVAFNN